MEKGLTRRSLLGAGAGALAAGALAPHGALAALAAPPRPRVRARALGDLRAGALETITLDRPADLLGLSWRAGDGSRLQLRLRGARGWSGWASAGCHGHAPEAPPPGGASVGDPVWVGGARVVQVRSPATLHGVSLHVVEDAGAGAPLALAAAAALAQPVLGAGAGQPPIIARRTWAGGSSPPRVAPEYGAVQLGFVHHTDNPNGYSAAAVPAMLRAIYAFHRYVNGWNDIGYNFVVDLYGRTWEARAGGIDEAVVGAHAGGYNLVSTGVAVLGTFSSVPITPAARAALERLLAWKLSLHGVPAIGRVVVRVNPAGASYSRFPANARVSLNRIAGHRDADSTDCPGTVLYGTLPAIRTRVSALAGRPAHLELTLTPSPPAPAAPGAPAAPSPVPAAGSPGTLGGVLSLLDGTPVAGASVQLQARTVAARGELVTETTVAEAVTDAEGRWSVAGAYVAVKRGGEALRALYAGGVAGVGACVSEGLRVAPAPVTAPAPAPTAPAP